MENSGNTNTILAVLTCVVIFFLIFEMFVNTENVNRVPDPPPVIQAPVIQVPPEQKQNVVVNVTTPQPVAPQQAAPAPVPTTIVMPVQRRRRRNNDNYRRRISSTPINVSVPLNLNTGDTTVDATGAEQLNVSPHQTVAGEQGDVNVQGDVTLEDSSQLTVG